jgi:hypothetical protein
MMCTSNEGLLVNSRSSGAVYSRLSSFGSLVHDLVCFIARPWNATAKFKNVWSHPAASIQARSHLALDLPQP